MSVTKEIPRFFAISSCFFISSLACSIFPTSFIAVFIPSCSNILAAATPSAPLFPIPATTSIFELTFFSSTDFLHLCEFKKLSSVFLLTQALADNSPYTFSISSTTPSAALSISTSDGIPISFIEILSICFASFASVIYLMS